MAKQAQKGLSGNAAIPHQIHIAYLVTNINNNLFFSKNLKFKNNICSAETKVPKVDNKQPDVLIFDPRTSNSEKIWIEVCKKQRGLLQGDKDKINLAFKRLPHLKEGFIFVYERNEWLKYRRTKMDFIRSSKSTWLGLDLADLVNTIHPQSWFKP
ncbi:hypothetical protein AWW67_02215 [Roseivirga seohaensis]|uniref:Uncharacterized protein n=1 Tax=Roseivirga seohaensis TaxID=1914963 RepID=A0A150XZ75_9BACT|nr:hypothetical protein [Roseivirga seohaensis]KYG83954.1 hypothetical protein AWW67_02215 [Roseivirga seohaensis]